MAALGGGKSDARRTVVLEGVVDPVRRGIEQEEQKRGGGDRIQEPSCSGLVRRFHRGVSFYSRTIFVKRMIFLIRYRFSL